MPAPEVLAREFTHSFLGSSNLLQCFMLRCTMTGGQGGAHQPALWIALGAWQASFRQEAGDDASHEQVCSMSRKLFPQSVERFAGQVGYEKTSAWCWYILRYRRTQVQFTAVNAVRYLI